MKIKNLARLIMLIALVNTIGAAEVKKFTVESAALFALENNADLAAARYALAEAKARLKSAGRWSNPAVETEFAPHVRGGEGSFKVGLNQRFPITARLRFEKSVSQAGVRIAEAELLEEERKLALETRLTTIRLAALDGQRQLKHRQIENNSNLVYSAEQIARAGEGSELDGTLLTLEGGQLAAQLSLLIAETAETTTYLQQLLGLTNSEVLEINESLPLPEGELALEISEFKRPDLKAALARVEAGTEELKLAQARRWEDATFGLFAEFERAEDFPKGIESEQFVGFHFSIPLPIWNRNEGGIAESRAKVQRLEKEADATIHRIKLETNAARTQMQAAAELARSIHGNLLPMARRIEDRLEKFQKEGRATFSDVLRARERRLQLESQELDARREYYLARVRYLAAGGTTNNGTK